MSKTKTAYVCQQCGARTPKWVGRCPECSEWNSMVEEIEAAPRARGSIAGSGSAPVALPDVAGAEYPRMAVGLSELDRILGGGAVAGSAVLVGGDPGIGKSTLLLQACDLICRSGKKALYVSAEESAAQIKMRADRIGASAPGLFVLAETDLDAILAHVEACRPDLLVVDSIQMVYTPSLESAPGTVSQVRDCGAELVHLAKRTGIAVFLVGHVTKEGTIAGPRVLEHIVDTVLYFEGDSFHAYRMLRAVKNRFGATNEVGIFEMRDCGLVPVSDPSKMFLSESARSAGSAVVSCMEGSRAFLVEVQALVSSATYGVPERKVSGADYNRVCMLLAVLEKRAGLQLRGQDVFVNVVGGMKVVEPAADLGIAIAIASSFMEQAVAPGTFMFGEVGLTGEVRPVTQTQARLKEGTRLGFKRVVLPRAGQDILEHDGRMQQVEVRTLLDALDSLGSAT